MMHTGNIICWCAGTTVALAGLGIIIWPALVYNNTDDLDNTTPPHPKLSILMAEDARRVGLRSCGCGLWPWQLLLALYSTVPAQRVSFGPELASRDEGAPREREGRTRGAVGCPYRHHKPLRTVLRV
jgi:hypothetical protein